MKRSSVRERLRSFTEKYGWLPPAAAALLAATIVLAILSLREEQPFTFTSDMGDMLQEISEVGRFPVAQNLVGEQSTPVTVEAVSIEREVLDQPTAEEQQRMAEAACLEEPLRAEAAKNARWRAMLPLIHERNHAQLMELVGTTTGLRQGMNDVRQALSANAYAEEVIGWESTAVRLQSESEHIDWMRTRFHELVLDPADMTEFFNKQLDRLHGSMTDSNRKMLQELGLSGTAYQPDNISVPKADFSSLDRQIDTLVRSTGDQHLQQAWGETAVSQVAGNVVLSLFNAGANSFFGTNQDEGESVFSSPFGSAGNLASQMIVSEAVESAIATSAKELSSRIEQDMQATMLTICGNSEQPASWESLFFDLTHQHFTCVISAIITETGVDEDYAVKTLVEYWEAAKQEQTPTNAASVGGGER